MEEINQIQHLRAELKKTKRQLRKAEEVLREMAKGICCECCTPYDPRCEVGSARDYFREKIK